MTTVFKDDFSEEVWRSTYKDFADVTVNDTMMRVAKYVAGAEETDELKALWADRFYSLLSGFKVTAGGRIYANAGTEYGGTTMMNCISADTLVHTSDGLIRADNIPTGKIKLLTINGIFEDAEWNSYGKQQLYAVTFVNGETIYATEGHEWLVTNPRNGNIEKVTTKSLVNRNVPLNGLLNYQYTNDQDYHDGIKNGLVFGDGYTYTDFTNGPKHSALQQFGDSRHLVLDYFGYTNVTYYKGDPEGIHYVSGLQPELKQIPPLTKSRDYLRGFLAGVIAADGHVDKNGSVMLHTSIYEYADQLRTIAIAAGIPVISLRVERAGSTYSKFATEDSKLWKLTFVKKYFQQDERLLLKNSHKINMLNSPTSVQKTTVKCLSVEPTDRIEEVYCCDQPTTHTFTIGSFGLITGNCFVSPRPATKVDSLPGILNDILNQTQTLKSEGGWGQNFSFIRPRGAFIQGIGVETPGAVKYMEIYDKTSDVITAGSGRKSNNSKAKGKIRKGAMMAVMDVWHPDIIEFITAKQQPGRLTKFNMSVNCTDTFMAKVIKVLEMKDAGASESELAEVDKWDLIFPDTTHNAYDASWQGDINKWLAAGYPVTVYRTVSASWLWNLIMESTYNRAEPGVLFLDRANYFGPLNYAETIYATNPSMPAGTLVHTQTGIFPINELEGKQFKVKSLDGEWANAVCRLSGEDEELLEIHLGANRSVKSTKEHRWPVYDTRMKRVYKAYAHELKTGDMIPLNRNETIGIFGDETLTFDEGFFVGYLIGDGWISKKGINEYNVGITFGSHERVMAERILNIINSLKSTPSTISYKETGELCIQFSSKPMLDKLFNRYGLIPGVKDIPSSVWRGNDNYIKGFVDGLLSADGNVYLDKNNQRVVLTTSREDLAQNFGKLLGFAGVPVSIWHRSVDDSSFPSGKDYDKTYERWDIAIHGRALLNFYNVFDISHPDKQQVLQEAIAYVTSNKRAGNQQQFVTVSAVTQAGRAKVWDISVAHNQHVFPTEWCYTGNCGEQTLAPGGVCNLGSLNLTQFVTDKGFDLVEIKKYTRYLVRFLDNINSLSHAPLPEYVDSMRHKRRIGVGILGWGSALFMLKVRFGSDRAAKLRDEVMSIIAKEAYMASIDLAEEKGMFRYCQPDKHAAGPFVNSLNLPEEYMAKLKKTGIRNSSLLSIQPTGNTSIFANVVSGGLEPVFMPEYVRTVIVGTMPPELDGKCPVWYEGEWKETELFKFAKEGDEQILRAEYNGTIYKIDKSRGLTKEVLCQDYGVRYLAERGEWDPNAEWAVTTLNLNVEDHVRDLKGFARWVDSAMSKTVNVPNNYPFDKFKDIYLDSYRSGYVKGVTTYRSGTMTTVLAAKEEKESEEEIIKEDVELPESAPSTMKTLKAEGKKWYLSVVYHETNHRPFALFVQTNAYEKNVVAEEAVEVLIALARKKKIPKRHIDGVLEKIEKDNNVNKTARLLSFLLRHGVLIKNIVAALDKVESAYAGSFVFAIKKFLSTYVKDGEPVEDAKCQNCGSTTIVFQEGCSVCKSCGSSKCG